MAEHTAVVDKGGTAFLHECAYLSGFRIEFQHAVGLMAAFVIFKSHRFPVFFPFRAIQVVLAVEEFGRRNDGLSCFHVEYARHLEAQFIARLGVFLLVKDGLKLSGTKILMKSGKKIADVKRELLLTECPAWMVENCGMEGERLIRSAADIPEDAGYYSLIIAKDREEQ